MFEYSRLNDFEFEKLCIDIMERKLKIELRYFPKGKDGGIDLVDDVINRNVLVQVKHFEKSNYASFKRSLKTEVEKVKKLKPKQYYIFTSQSLTPQNIKEVYSLFQDYMKSEKNIITREDIDRFLESEDNLDILRSQFKLWVVTDHVLKDYLNQEVFIDSEVLISDIEEELKYFVQTDIFNFCIEILERERKVLLYGDPGVGKTINSKMLLLHFIRDGYKVRFSTNGDIDTIKRAVTLNKDLKEVIFLDDFLGQHYFKLKDGQDQQLLSLIKFVEQHKNKIIILNSRVTILNEANNAYEALNRYFSTQQMQMRRINMNEIRDVEKARIFYALLVKNKVTDDYYNSVRRDKNYMHIVQHRNYNPRVIEYVTLPIKVEAVVKTDYYEFILENLNNPKDIWRNEFELRIKDLDRTFMYILYSLTDTLVSIEVFKKSFNYYISTNLNVDNTINNFESILQRLNHSMIKVVDDYNGIKVGVSNPSINDYLKDATFRNDLMLENLKRKSVYLDQLERLYSPDDFNDVLRQLVVNEKVLEYSTIQKEKLHEIIIYTVAEHTILKEAYEESLNLLVSLDSFTRIGKHSMNKINLIQSFLQNEHLRNYYKIDEKLGSIENMEILFEGLSFEEHIILLDLIINVMMKNRRIDKVDKDYFIKMVLSELEYYIDTYNYINTVDELCEIDLFKDDSYEELHSVKEVVKGEVMSIIDLTEDADVKSNLIRVLQEFDSTVESYIEDAFSEVRTSRKTKPQKLKGNSEISIDDVLDRPVRSYRV
ncbi:restriction endonuclease [Planomicrobium soli]|uniref:Restriction endonuclease n=1 Tax=Planomicrobium soli TaxID=1176648 RepID=A0A2P8H5U0_9BACL|nr:restriction endonuclease [Planomicrobium soli]PSL41573.1 restriction endonuclease [Planomicrobium soli]